MKKVFYILLAIIICSLNYSCEKKTCTSGYNGSIKIDGKKGDKVSIKYIGSEKKKYKEEFGFSLENELPYAYEFSAFTTCSTTDFKNHRNYDFLEIKNTSSEDIYIFANISGEEVNGYNYYYRQLINIYNKQDKDPKYDYTKEENYKDVKYIDRYELYEKLLKEEYPYIIKLAPQKTCIMKWGGLGFKVL